MVRIVLFWMSMIFLGFSESSLISSLTNADIENSTPPNPSKSVSLFDYDLPIEKSSKAYKSIQQGYGHLLGNWDFQAYRFFLEALKEEPNSLFATSGITLALIGGDVHLAPQIKASVIRHRELLKNAEGSEFELAFARAVSLLTERQITKWTDELKKISSQKELGWELPELLHYLFARDGYTLLGEPKIGQQKAIAGLESLCQELPNTPAPHAYLVASQLDNPNATLLADKGDLVTSARRLTRFYPSYPYYQLLVGCSELKCGELILSTEPLRQAIRLYEKHKDYESVLERNLISLVEARLNLITALTLQHDFESADLELRKLLSTELPVEQSRSLVGSALHWEASSFPMRIACYRDSEWLMKKRAADIRERFGKKKLADLKLPEQFLMTLAAYASSRVAIQAKNFTLAEEELLKFSEAGSSVINNSGKALLNNEVPYWERASALITLLEFELKARFEVVDKSDKISVISKITEAIDRQQPTRGVMPPLWLSPMETYKGDYLLSKGEYEEALIAYQEASNRILNHQPTLKGLQKTYSALGKTTEAERIQNKLDALLFKE